MTDLLVDTDVLVDFLRGNPLAVDFLQANATRVVLSSIVLAELYAGARNGELAELDDFSGLFPVKPITAQIARAGGLLKVRYGKSHGLGLADALIAGTAQQYGFTVQTLNVKHFPMFPGLVPPYRK